MQIGSNAIHVGYLSHQLIILGNLLADDIQAGTPDVLVRVVHSESAATGLESIIRVEKNRS